MGYLLSQGEAKGECPPEERVKPSELWETFYVPGSYGDYVNHNALWEMEFSYSVHNALWGLEFF